MACPTFTQSRATSTLLPDASTTPPLPPKNELYAAIQRAAQMLPHPPTPNESRTQAAPGSPQRGAYQHNQLRPGSAPHPATTPRETPSPFQTLVQTGPKSERTSSPS